MQGMRLTRSQVAQMALNYVANGDLEFVILLPGFLNAKIAGMLHHTQ